VQCIAQIILSLITLSGLEENIKKGVSGTMIGTTVTVYPYDSIIILLLHTIANYLL
jgi:hypothetical protein